MTGRASRPRHRGRPAGANGRAHARARAAWGAGEGSGGARSTPGRLVASALAAAESWLLEPVEAESERPAASPGAAEPTPYPEAAELAPSLGAAGATPYPEAAELAPSLGAAGATPYPEAAELAPSLGLAGAAPYPVAAELAPDSTAAELAPYPVVAVFGLSRGCGVTVVSRALAAELARRDAAGAAAVHCGSGAGRTRLASRAAGRLARLLAEVPRAATRAAGRLCLVSKADPAVLAGVARWHAPLVIDAGGRPVGGPPAALADAVVLVAGRRADPALAAVAAGCLAREGSAAVVVRNRGELDETWRPRAVLALPDSRTGAQLALAGREARGGLGRAVAELADICEGVR